MVPPSSLEIRQGALPRFLGKRVRLRHRDASLLLLPRAKDEAYRDSGPVYLDFDNDALETLRRNGASVDFLDKAPKLVAQFSKRDWIDFAAAVDERVDAKTVLAIARYLVSRVSTVRRSGDQPALDLLIGNTGDRTFLRITRPDPEAVLKAFYSNLAMGVADPKARNLLSNLAAGADPSTPLERLVIDPAETDPTDTVKDSGEAEPPKRRIKDFMDERIREHQVRQSEAQETGREPQPVRLFYSYSHRDEKFRERLEIHLAALRRQGLIEEWHDRKITAGREWKNDIDENLEAADIILLLVSSDFLASDYAYNKEFMRALERHKSGEVRIVPIILRYSDWQETPIGDLQALPPEGKPVAGRGDRGWTEVAKGLRQVIREVQKAR